MTSSSRCDVIVGVVDENDNSPEFLFPSDDNHTVLIGRGVMDEGGRLVQLEATDRDDGANANLTFFVDGADRHLGIDVESTSGLSNCLLH